MPTLPLFVGFQIPTPSPPWRTDCSGPSSRGELFRRNSNSLALILCRALGERIVLASAPDAPSRPCASNKIGERWSTGPPFARHYKGPSYGKGERMQLPVTKWLTPTCVVFVFLCGCGKPTAPYQRFVPLSRQPESLKGDAWQGTYALDTKTGQLCVTFDPSAFSSVSAIPTCLKLYHDFPD